MRTPRKYFLTYAPACASAGSASGLPGPRVRALCHVYCLLPLRRPLVHTKDRNGIHPTPEESSEIAGNGCFPLSIHPPSRSQGRGPNLKLTTKGPFFTSTIHGGSNYNERFAKQTFLRPHSTPRRGGIKNEKHRL